MNKDLAIQGSGIGGAFTVYEVKEQVQLIQGVMKEVMIENTHYGKIPGTDKESLWKAGAEKLLLTFRLRAEYEEINVTETKDFISYRIKCKLYHIPTGLFMGEGMGACNTQEKKYRTVSVSENKATEEDKATGRAEKRPGKNGGSYTVFIIPSNPYDLQNTVYKMSQKRSLVAAVLNCTAASDIFTQDLEDMDVIPNDNEDKKTTEIKQPEEKKKEPTNQQATMDAPPKGSVIAGIATDFKDKETQGKLKELGFKWQAQKKIWYKVVTMEEFKQLGETYTNIEVID